MNHPVSRRLKIMAFDPSLATRLDTSAINDLTANVIWEDDLEPGPIGEYIEVIDFDPASGVFYEPVDLDDPHLLAQDGLPASESNPQFHQQMVYAVAMQTIREFERALGRPVFWSDHTEIRNGEYKVQFVRRLRIYPHALRDRNAYYSPSKKALLFGYFPVLHRDEHNTPGTLVFTCLSHDIIAHEVTHALLDGVHPRFNEPTNPDVHAFHEAFSDVVALFQHFSHSSVLEHQIRTTRGNLETENLLSQLAQQFGLATGRGSALRDALGHMDEESGRWKVRKPDPNALENTFQAHARGGILVAAIFRAFILIYRERTADLFRLATQGTGVLPEGDIHPDLTKRLAREAAKCAGRVLQICVRAIDYCPPVNITFGNYLRGIITADLDVSPEDEGGYRIVFIQSFREWGIHPRGTTSMGVDALTWPSGDDVMEEMVETGQMKRATVNSMGTAIKASNDGKGGLKELYVDYIDGWNLESDRYEVWKKLERVGWKVWKWLGAQELLSNGNEFATLFGLVTDNELAPPTVRRTNRKEGKETVTAPAIEIHSVRPAIRKTLSGQVRTDLVIEVTQRRDGYFTREEQKEKDQRDRKPTSRDKPDFIYRTGATILIDPATQRIRRIIRTPGDIADNDELERVRRYLVGDQGATGNAFDAGLAVSRRVAGGNADSEPFALLHQPAES